MSKKLIFIYGLVMIAILIFPSCTKAAPMIEPTVTYSATSTETSTPTPTASPTASATPTRTPTKTIPIGELIYHEADETITYDWFSYIPTTVNPTYQNTLWVTGLHANIRSGIYSDMRDESRKIAEFSIQLAEQYGYILLAPVLPRTNAYYSAALPYIVFQENTDPYFQRPDEKVILMIDKYLSDLRSDGYNMEDKVNMNGFSAGGMFAQRFTLLHPERVKALAAGSPGGFLTIPESIFETTELKWPLGIADFSSLAGYDFDLEEYKKVPQFFFIGDKDVNNSTVREGREIGVIWHSNSQITFLNNTFGETDPVRLENQVNYLNRVGFTNIIFRSYPEVPHLMTDYMVEDMFSFFINHTLPEVDPSDVYSTPSHITMADPTPTTAPMMLAEPITQISATDSMTMVFVPAGTFFMGSNREDRYEENPQHKVYVDAFWIDQTEVTNAMYAQCVEDGQCQQPVKWGFETIVDYFGNPVYDIYPVFSVSWDEAKTYCEWAGRRLLTEAEWEKAARGTDHRVFPWGDTINSGRLANFADRNYGTAWSEMTIDDGFRELAPVGSYLEGASPYGALDMAGNAAEWVADWFGNYPQDSQAEILSNPMGPSTGEEKVIKGGNFSESVEGGIRSASRGYKNPAEVVWGTGIRCAVTNP